MNVISNNITGEQFEISSTVLLKFMRDKRFLPKKKNYVSGLKYLKLTFLKFLMTEI